MSYIGRQPQIGNFQICDAISTVNNQAAYTMQVGSVNVEPETANHMIVSLNGVIQKPNSSYTVAGAVITFASNLVTGDVINFIQILGSVLDLGVPSDDTVSTVKLQNDSVTTDKLANSINSAITANTAKVTNANHSGEVTGATALTIADNIVDEANLKVSNSAVNGYVLSAQSGNTGGLTWVEAASGGLVQTVLGTSSSSESSSSTSYIDSNLTLNITPSSSSNKIILMAHLCIEAASGSVHCDIRRTVSASGTLISGDADGFLRQQNAGQQNVGAIVYKDTPNTTSEITYTVAYKNAGGTSNFNNAQSIISLVAMEVSV